jgi:hypothetical protein
MKKFLLGLSAVVAFLLPLSEHAQAHWVYYYRYYCTITLTGITATGIMAIGMPGSGTRVTVLMDLNRTGPAGLSIQQSLLPCMVLLAFTR